MHKCGIGFHCVSKSVINSTFPLDVAKTHHELVGKSNGKQFTNALTERDSDRKLYEPLKPLPEINVEGQTWSASRLDA
jgi:hypothetical protein